MQQVQRLLCTSMCVQVADLKALRDLLLFHADDIEDIMSALKAHQDFSACALARFAASRMHAVHSAVQAQLL